jgi:3-deoxy-D-manno-octulosonic-acid transferase
MTHLLYNIGMTAALPFGAASLAVRRRPIWVHACSVGEVAAARPLLDALVKRWPDTPVLLTTSTLTGRALADQLKNGAAVTWFPVDQRQVVGHFFRRVRPRVLALLETEIWPNVVGVAARRGVPVLVASGRISDKHYARYLRHRRFFQAVFEQITAVGAQNPEYARRFQELGVDAARIRVTGNVKFDGVTTNIPEETRARLRRECELPPEAPVIVFGSTRPGDEALAARAWKTFAKGYPEARLVVAPRHLDRLEEAKQALDGPLSRLSERRCDPPGPAARILLVDTLGELTAFYSLATIAVIGGSFFPGVNGHNPLEPAALGVPTVFGPYMSNFMDPTRVLVEAYAAVQVDSPEELPNALKRLLADPALRARLGQRARESVLANQGAVERTVELIAETMLKSGPVR